MKQAFFIVARATPHDDGQHWDISSFNLPEIKQRAEAEAIAGDAAEQNPDATYLVLHCVSIAKGKRK
jgi:hypothetical protein